MESVNGTMVIRVQKGQRSGDTFEQRSQKVDDLAIVEKLYDRPTGSTVFVAAGLGVVGTMGAVHFIIGNWSRLHKDFDQNPFALCLRFQDIKNDPNAYKRPVELARFQ